MTLRIIHALRAAPFGGAQRVAIDLAHEQARQGHAVELLLTGRDRGSAQRAIEAAGH